MELIIAVLDRIKSELDLCYWNKYQEEMDSPFENTGAQYSNDIFTVRAYSWSDDEAEAEKPNFESDFLTCWWYKHSHRDLEYRIIFDADSEFSEMEQLSLFLNKCLHSIRLDFAEDDKELN